MTAPPRTEHGSAPVAPSGARDAWSRAVAAVGAVLAGVGVWASWYIFVGTRSGQLLDHAAMEGAVYGRTELWQVAEVVLGVISLPFLAVVLLVAVAVALVRRRYLLAVQVALLMAGANLTAQLLKHAVFDRPNLSVWGRLANTLPSGHTVAAASCAVALVLVAPRRLRVATAVVGAVYTAATGISTLVGAWHRPADVVAALLLVLAWACVVLAIGPVTKPAPRPVHRRETAAISLLVGGALASGGASAVAAVRTREALETVSWSWDTTGLESSRDLIVAYGGGALGIVATVCVTFAGLLILLRSREPKITDLA